MDIFNGNDHIALIFIWFILYITFPNYIWNNVIIGSHAQIIGNIVIEDGVVIGSNAIVTKNVEKGKTIISNNLSI